jgi:hypothetical protein
MYAQITNSTKDKKKLAEIRNAVFMSAIVSRTVPGKLGFRKLRLSRDSKLTHHQSASIFRLPA